MCMSMYVSRYVYIYLRKNICKVQGSLLYLQNMIRYRVCRAYLAYRCPALAFVPLQLLAALVPETW